MENNVVTLDTAKQLKAAGFPQKTHFNWYPPHKSIDGDWEISPGRTWLTAAGQPCAAPTAQEIADQLPKSKRWPSSRNDAYLSMYLDPNHKWGVGYEEEIDYEGGYFHVLEFANTMAEALALLWLKLQEAK